MPEQVTDWTAATIERLEAWWNEGLSAAEIARRLHTTRNAVIGKARRLGLPARPSPIVRTSPKPPPVNPRKPRRVPIAAAVASFLAPPVVPTAVLTAPPPPPPPPPPPMSARRGCAWPLWDDQERATQRFCDATLVPGHSWCARHLAVVQGRRVV
jgi:GcrA cell cycle regulator